MAKTLSNRARWGLAGLILLLALPGAAAATDTPFLIGVVTRFLIYGLAAVSLDLVIGYGAMVSFGHAMFFGLGGYAVGIIAFHTTEAGPLFGWAGSNAALVVWPIALAVCALAGWLFGYLALRTRGVQFIMITLAFALACGRPTGATGMGDMEVAGVMVPESNGGSVAIRMSAIATRWHPPRPVTRTSCRSDPRGRCQWPLPGLLGHHHDRERLWALGTSAPSTTPPQRISTRHGAALPPKTSRTPCGSNSPLHGSARSAMSAMSVPGRSLRA